MMLPIGRHRRIVLPADFTLCNPKKLRYWKPSPSRPKPSPREELDAEWASVEHSISELEHAVAAKEAEFKKNNLVRRVLFDESCYCSVYYHNKQHVSTEENQASCV